MTMYKPIATRKLASLLYRMQARVFQEMGFHLSSHYIVLFERLPEQLQNIWLSYAERLLENLDIRDKDQLELEGE